MGYVTHIAEGIANLYANNIISRGEAARAFVDFSDPLNQPNTEWEEIEYQYEKKKKGKTRPGLNEEMMKLIPIGVCIRCQTLMYLGMTNCSKCGAPVGESIDLEELQDKVQELLKPDTEYIERPYHGAMVPMIASSDECVVYSNTTAGPYITYGTPTWATTAEAY